ncbi:hypothetical protein [Falsiruegeria litorea]|nr:hypothetical protein [Falsiruegeria litorea]
MGRNEGLYGRPPGHGGGRSCASIPLEEGIRQTYAWFLSLDAADLRQK